MSRIGKKPIKVPAGVNIFFNDNIIRVEGNNGKLERALHPAISINIEDNTIIVVPNSETPKIRAFQGMTRALLANMIIGVSKGFERGLEINGIGYKAEVKEKKVIFSIGYSHTIDFTLPDGVGAKIEKNILTLNGNDKELLGHTAASIRQLRKPEPYKGKGIKYVEEKIIRKAGKTGAA
jgi:large subunit ribosomal protein L6